MGTWVYGCMDGIGMWVYGCMDGIGMWVYGCMGVCVYMYVGMVYGATMVGIADMYTH